MALNKLTDLNNHLFAQLERLGEEELTPEQLASEVSRAKAISAVADKIIQNAKVTLEAVQFTYRKLDSNKQLPEMFKIEN